MIDYIRGKVPEEELLAQLAEEATELSHAALKLRRVLDGQNPTPVRMSEAYANLQEEVADVLLCLQVLGIEIQDPTIYRTQEEKSIRWARRLQERPGVFDGED
jgi:NTP pyrophosphatase (non-canonical NTP hydrolase)